MTHILLSAILLCKIIGNSINIAYSDTGNNNTGQKGVWGQQTWIYQCQNVVTNSLGVTGCMNKEIKVDAVYLDFSNVFEMVFHTNLKDRTD